MNSPTLKVYTPMPYLNSLFWLTLSFFLLLVLQRWTSRHLRGTVLLISRNEEAASLAYFVLLLPGVLLHELSHWLMAKLLWVRTGKLTVGLNQRRGGRLEMGSVQVSQTDPIRNSLIGLAPLVGGGLAIFLIGRWALGIETLARTLQSGDGAHVAAELWAAIHVPDFWLWLYLIFAISNAMLPSASDRRSWPPVLIFLGVLGALLYLSGRVHSLPPQLVGLLTDALSYLNLAFTLTLAVDVAFALMVLPFELLLIRLTGWRVEY
jgi:hypothetical protein